MTQQHYVECGCCGYYHRSDYYGDCRNDEERFTGQDLDDKGVDWGLVDEFDERDMSSFAHITTKEQT